MYSLGIPLKLAALFRKKQFAKVKENMSVNKKAML